MAIVDGACPLYLMYSVKTTTCAILLHWLEAFYCGWGTALIHKINWSIDRWTPYSLQEMKDFLGALTASRANLHVMLVLLNVFVLAAAADAVAVRFIICPLPVTALCFNKRASAYGQENAHQQS